MELTLPGYKIIYCRCYGWFFKAVELEKFSSKVPSIIKLLQENNISYLKEYSLWEFAQAHFNSKLPQPLAIRKVLTWFKSATHSYITKSFNIPRNTLLLKGKIKKVSVSYMGKNFLFSSKQANILSNRVLRLGKLFYGITRNELKACIYEFAVRNLVSVGKTRWRR